MHDEAKKVSWTSFVFALRYDCLRGLPSHPSPFDKYWRIRYQFNLRIYMIMAVQASMLINDDIYIYIKAIYYDIFLNEGKKQTLNQHLRTVLKREKEAHWSKRNALPEKNKSIISNNEIRKLETFIMKYELNEKTKYNYMRLRHVQSKNINRTPFVRINWAFHDRIRAALVL